MTGNTRAQGMIGGNILVAIQTRLAGSGWRAFGANLKIEVAGRIRYPDAFVVCTSRSARQTVIRDPVVVLEVLSESTSRTDRIAKLREYGATPSIQRYVILEQDAIAAMVFVRKGTDLVAEALTADDTLHMPEIGVSVAMSDFYNGVEVADETAAQTG